MDKLLIHDIRAYGYTGYFEAEHELGQWFSVDLAFRLDLEAAGAEDELAQTLNYAEAVQTVQTLIRQAKFRTIERLATAIAEQLLQNQAIETVNIRLTKCQPPIPDFDGHVTVELERSR
ncbi:MAG: dihydroneopterin aldolase [Cyanobacteria bacterium P01_H01_bin.121]